MEGETIVRANGLNLAVEEGATEEQILNEIADMFPGTSKDNLKLVKNTDGSYSADIKAGTKG